MIKAFVAGIERNFELDMRAVIAIEQALRPLTIIKIADDASNNGSVSFDVLCRVLFEACKDKGTLTYQVWQEAIYEEGYLTHLETFGDVVALFFQNLMEKKDKTAIKMKAVPKE